MRMLSQYFAQYLLNNNFLTPKQVCEVLEEENEHRVKLGIIAIDQGLMTAKEVESVNELQVRFDQRFGEVAVSEGFLTDTQVCELLNMQENSNLNFGQTLIDKNLMTLGQLESALAEYKGNNKLAINIALNKIEITKINFDEIEEVKEIYSEYVDLFLRVLVRFMDSAGVIVPSEQPLEEAAKGRWLVSQRMTGDVAITTGVLIAEPVLLEMARRYSKEDLTEVDELAVDSIAEFMNVTNGLFIVNLSTRHLDLDLEPQKNGKNVIPFGSKQAVIDINTNFGLIKLIIAADDVQ